ncbi:MAG: enoyl-CoA hydratase/isomerase family protein [Anaerolineae bacterium]|nr:enoyl-CoA hydratase/isomerase family protein [Anaerolineae bacterium]
MTDQLILLDKRDDGIAIITLNRPDKLNALSTALLNQFDTLLHDLADDPQVRVIILTGAGEKAFVAGADIGEYSGQEYGEFVDYQFYSRRLFTYLDEFPKPVIGAINGYALGGGFEIALCCDVLIASANARFGLPEGLLGLCPGGGGTQKLTRAVGRYVAADVLLSARRLSAERAYELGLVAEVVEPGELLQAAITKAQYMLKVAPLAQREMKRLIRQGVDAPLVTGLSLEQEVLFRLNQTHDGQEGIRAFMEKRDPKFEGR